MRTATHMLSLLVIGLCAIVAEAAPPQRKFDSADVDRVLSNDRILTNYIRCLMDEGVCTTEARDLKKLLPDVLATGCAKCTEKQQQTTQKVVRHLQTKRPADWTRLTTKYDPSGELRKRYQTSGASAATSSAAPSPAAAPANKSGASGAATPTPAAAAAPAPASNKRGAVRH